MAKVLIVGPGYVGSELSEELARDGHRVFALSRTGAYKNSSRKGGAVQFLRGDVTDHAKIPQLPSEIDRVVYLVAADQASEQSYVAAYVNGVRNLVSALTAAKCNLQRFVFVSSTSVYEQVNGEAVDEDTALHPESYMARALLAGEAEAKKLPNAIALRLSGIYGPGRERLLDEVSSGKKFSRATSRMISNRIHRDDCVGSIKHLLFAPNPGQVYVGVDDEPAALGEVWEWIASKLGVTLKYDEELEQRDIQRGNKRCLNGQLKASGFKFKYPSFREGYGELIQLRKR